MRRSSILPGASYMVLWVQMRSQSVTPPHASWGKQIASVSLYLLAIPAAYIRPWVSLALIGIVAVIWLLPPKVEAVSEVGHGHAARRAGKDSATPQADNR